MEAYGWTLRRRANLPISAISSRQRRAIGLRRLVRRWARGGSIELRKTALSSAEWQYQGHGERQERRDPGQGGRRHQRFGASRTAKVRGCKWRCSSHRIAIEDGASFQGKIDIQREPGRPRLRRCRAITCRGAVIDASVADNVMRFFRALRTKASAPPFRRNGPAAPAAWRRSLGC